MAFLMAFLTECAFAEAEENSKIDFTFYCEGVLSNYSTTGTLIDSEIREFRLDIDLTKKVMSYYSGASVRPIELNLEEETPRRAYTYFGTDIPSPKLEELQKDGSKKIVPVEHHYLRISRQSLQFTFHSGYLPHSAYTENIGKCEPYKLII